MTARTPAGVLTPAGAWPGGFAPGSPPFWGNLGEKPLPSPARRGILDAELPNMRPLPGRKPVRVCQRSSHPTRGRQHKLRAVQVAETERSSHPIRGQLCPGQKNTVKPLNHGCDSAVFRFAFFGGLLRGAKKTAAPNGAAVCDGGVMEFIAGSRGVSTLSG